MSKRKNKPTSRANFKPGEKVQVRHGVSDTDYPDMPLGGWKGVIVEVHGDCIYTVRWGKETLASINPVFKARCENDGLEFDQDCLRIDEQRHSA